MKSKFDIKHDDANKQPPHMHFLPKLVLGIGYNKHFLFEALIVLDSQHLNQPWPYKTCSSLNVKTDVNMYCVKIKSGISGKKRYITLSHVTPYYS